MFQKATIMSVSRKSPFSTFRRFLFQIQRSKVAYLFILPTFAFLALFLYYPLAIALWGAFTDWDGFNAANFTGLENFKRIFTDSAMLTATQNNLLWAIVGVFVSIIPSLLVAIVIFNLNNHWSQNLYRSLFVIPLVVPTVVSILLWSSFYKSDGLINQVLSSVGLGSLVHSWLIDGKTALWALMLMGFPWVFPFSLLIFYAGLLGISKEVLDAAKIDGALGFQRILHIDIPLILPQIRLILILAFVNSTQKLIEPLIMTNGGPGYTTTVPILHMYKTAIQYGEFGYSMSISFLVFVVTLVMSVLANRIQRGD